MLNQYLRGIAGLVILVSLVLGLTVCEHFFYLTGFVGLNLIQSSFTNWCPMMTFLRLAGVSDTYPIDKPLNKEK